MSEPEEYPIAKCPWCGSEKAPQGDRVFSGNMQAEGFAIRCCENVWNGCGARSPICETPAMACEVWAAMPEFGKEKENGNE